MRMLSRVGALTLLAMVGVLLVFFCPAATGPFSVTNGPATAFRALDAARGVFASISAALLVVALQCVCRLEFLTQVAVPASSDPELFALRC
jgi:uncharacterized membrane protein